MSQTTTTQAPVQSFYFDPQAWDYIRPQVREYVVLAVLPCALYGEDKYPEFIEHWFGFD